MSLLDAFARLDLGSVRMGRAATIDADRYLAAEGLDARTEGQVLRDPKGPLSALPLSARARRALHWI